MFSFFPIEQSEDFSFIVLESRLKAASDLAGEEIVLKINGDFNELNVGNIKSKFNNGTSTVEDFVKIPTFNDKTIRFTPEIIASFDIAKLYVAKDNLRPSMTYVYLDEK